MARISKYKIDEMVLFLLIKANKKLQKINESRKEFVTTLYKSSIPEKILQLSEEYRNEYCNKSNNLSVMVEGYGYTAYIMSEYLPIRRVTTFSIVGADAIKLVKLNNEHKSLKEEITKLRISLYDTISKLGTEKRICTEFPELEKFFIKNEQVTALALPISSLREQLKSY